MKLVISVKCSTLVRTLLLLTAVVLSGVFAAALLLGWERHPETMKVAEVLFYLGVLYLYVAISFRFVVRLDENHISRREMFRTRTLSLDKVLSIRVAQERKLFGWIPFLKIEILGEEGRILVSWHEKKLEPLLEALRRRFPDKLAPVERLPDD